MPKIDLAMIEQINRTNCPVCPDVNFRWPRGLFHCKDGSAF